jgi:lactate dehydrogenase-like 2-hydroxyacid dehydrogenase
MTKPNLLVTRRLPEAVEARALRDYNARLNLADTPTTPAGILAASVGMDAILCCTSDRLDAATIAALPASVRVISTFSVGTDHIDLPEAKARGIPVCNTPDVLTEATAELSMLLILAASRRAGEGERIVRADGWSGWAPTQLMGRQVSGKRLGIFGMGRIGQSLARMARGFNMAVHYRNRSRLAPELEAGAVYHDNDASFLAQCDVLALNAPGGAATLKWLNAARIAMLPRGAVVTNAARGTLVDDDALIAALKSGHVSFAGLDVFTGEPAINPGYRALENAVLLPHLGSATIETRDAMGHLALDGVDAILRGTIPKNIVQ